MSDQSIVGLPALFTEDARFTKDVYVYGRLFANLETGGLGLGTNTINVKNGVFDNLLVTGFSTFIGPSNFLSTATFNDINVNNLFVNGFSTFVGPSNFLSTATFNDIEVNGKAGFRSDTFFDKEILNLRIGILTVSQKLDVGIGGTVFTAISSLSNVGIGSTLPQQKIDIAGSAKIDQFIYDSVNSPGLNGYYLNVDQQGIRWIPATPNFTEGIYVQDEGVYLPITGLAKSFTVLNFTQINSLGMGTDNIIPIPNPNNPNFIANIQSQDFWGFNGSGDIYRMTNVGIKNSAPLYDLDITGSLHATSNVVFNSTLEVDGSTTLKDTLEVDKATTLKDTLEVDGATTLKSTLEVDKSTTLKDTLEVDKATTLKNTLEVDSYSTFKDFIKLDSSLYDVNNSNAFGKFDYRLSSVGTGVSWRPPGVQTKNSIWVTMNGDDSNSGYLEGDAKRTIGAAASIAEPGDTIFVRSGVYVENNPIGLRTDVCVSGQDLRLVNVIPQNLTKDIFHVRRGCLIENISFSCPNISIANTGGAAIAFPPPDPENFAVSGYIYPGPVNEGPSGRWRSPYIRNCTNFMKESIGMKINGDHATASTIGADLKCMVCDSFTQYNENGIGVSITNNGYAQLVSIFTINCDTAIYADSGGACDLTNSNSSFGNYGLVAVGLGRTEFTGKVGTYPPTRFQPGVNAGSDTVNFLNIADVFQNPRRPYDGQALFFKIDLLNYADANVIGLSTTILQQPMVRVDSIKVTNGGSGYSAVSPPTIIIRDKDDRTQQPKGPQGIIAEVSPTIDPVSGAITAIDVINSGRNYLPTQNLEVFIDGDGGATADVITQPIYYTVDVATPPTTAIGRFADAVNLIVKNYDFIATEAVDRMLYYYNVSPLQTNFSIPTGNFRCVTDIKLVLNSINHNLQFGGNDWTYDAAKIYVDNPYLSGEESQSITAFNYARDICKQVIDNVIVSKQGYTGINSYTQYRDLSIIADPLTGSNTDPNSCANVKTAIDNLFSIITTAIDPLSNPRLPSSKTVGNTIGITTVTFNEFIPYELFGYEEVSLKRISRILTSSHSFEYIGTGTDINSSTPFKGAIPIKANEVVARDGAQVPFTSTDQKGNFDIGKGFQINQPTSTIRGRDFSKAIQAEVTPLILALR